MDDLIVLQRIAYGDNGVFGVITRYDRPLLVTLELPWRNNRQGISCVPAGRYLTSKMFSPKFQKEVFVLVSVPGRDLIEFHIGNKIANSNGCILLGTSFMMTDYAILNSLNAFQGFMQMMPKEGFTIYIKDLNNETSTIATQSQV
jgi:hypothetical protein